MRKILSTIAIFLLVVSFDINVIPGNRTNESYEKDQSSIHNIADKVSLLAPPTNVLFNSGRIDGTLIADSVKGAGRSSSYRFDHDVPTTVVSEPSTITLFLSEATILLGFKKRI